METLQPNSVQTLAVWTPFVWYIVCSERLWQLQAAENIYCRLHNCERQDFVQRVI